ncbi:uncharacterized protein LOC107275152 [Cephus cinctus]|uniref:Uncharacterized protein LOC107275152 n=1 Tax=Cephus cinctus TaxID=211228 RepID=A0AAJ7CGQ3_CEPCN|nr:uncharacterized protein LOC107275152 [Cephus cinctus]
MSEEDGDAELFELERSKSELLKKIDALKKVSEKIGSQCRRYKLPPKKIFGNGHSAANSGQSNTDGNTVKLLCDASRHATGVSFKNVDRKWLKHDTYLYTAYVKMKVARFFLDLTVETKGESELKILDITCHFVGVADCYLLEITPWVQQIATAKDFSYMMTVLSDHSEQCVLRVKILDKVNKNKYVTVKQCEEGIGGFVILINSHTDNEPNSIKVQWSLKYTERSCRIDHKFQMWAVGSGLEFMKENSQIVENFYRKSLNETDLDKIWSDLLDAIDKFEEEGKFNAP